MPFTCVLNGFFFFFFYFLRVFVVIVYCRCALRSKLEPLTSISIYFLIFYAMSGMRFASLCTRSYLCTQCRESHIIILYVYSCIWVCNAYYASYIKWNFLIFKTLRVELLFFAVYFVLFFIHCLCARPPALCLSLLCASHCNCNAVCYYEQPMNQTSFQY